MRHINLADDSAYNRQKTIVLSDWMPFVNNVLGSNASGATLISSSTAYDRS